MRHPYMRAVRWNEAEKQLIAEESLRVLASEPNITRLEALRKGVQALDKSRRREIVDMAQAKWVLPMWEEIAAKRDAMNGQVATESVPLVANGAPMSAAPASREIAGAPLTIVPAAPSAGPVGEGEEPKRHRGMVKGTKLVRWSEEERRTIAKGIIKLRADFPDMKILEALRKSMQYHLPDNRQRKIAGLSTEPWVMPLIKAVESEANAEIEAAHAQREASLEAEQRALEEARARTAHEEQEAARIALERQVAIEQAVEDYRANVPLEELLLLIGKRAAAAALGSLVETLQTQVVAQLVGGAAASMRGRWR